MTQKAWKIKNPDILLQKKLARDLSISPLSAQLLINRGIISGACAKEFLGSDINALHDARLLPDIDKAARRVRKALSAKEKVLLFSDYDADGLTSLALLKRAFIRLGVDCEHYLPHRLTEGYGLSGKAVEYARSGGFHLVVTLDCGIANFKEIEELRKSNIDTIVIDHHMVSEPLPPAHSVINPKRHDSKYPYPDLAGVGLAYKFASYLLDELLEDELDLVCLGTVADVAPLLGENRILVREGLKKLNATGRAGLKSLVEISGIKRKIIDTRQISYILGPRLNACGRIGSAEDALSLLLVDAQDQALALAGQLHSKNKERGRIEAEIIDEALCKIETEMDFSRERVIVLHQEGWHQGVLGIVAAKISDRYHRPAIVISFNDGIGKGSGRSIENFHLFEGLRECKEHLLGFGGHKRACGLSLSRSSVEDFRRAINEVALRTLKPQDLVPSLDIEMELGLSGLNLDLLEELRLFEPFGQGNPRPIFATCNLQVKSAATVVGRDTLKFWVSDGKATYPAVGFSMGRYLGLVKSARTIDLAYRLSLDTYQGNHQLQLELEDIR